MNKILIENVHPTYDGEYELDLGFTNRELHKIKRISGVRVGEIDDALRAVDTDVVLALGVIVLEREGKPVHEDVLWDAQGGSIRLVTEDEPGPPAEAQETPVADGKTSGSNASSGNDSSNDSALSASDPSPTGTPPSDTSAASASTTSAS